ncbi:MAG: hypothetical protein R3B13_14555 [Polyangiaceae bacterium]
MTDREAIMRRRRRFVAAALTGVGAALPAAGCAETIPCLSPMRETPYVPESDAGDAGPSEETVELSDDAMVSSGEEPDAGEVTNSDAEPPQPCLSPEPPPKPTRPKICLDFE